MTESELAAAPSAEQDSPAADSQGDPAKDSTKSSKSFNASFSIWPPSQRTRDAVVKRLTETLSSPSVLSRRYGTVPHEEAADAARVVEEEAYSLAGAHASDGVDGIEILQLYSKEISKGSLETVKARASSDSAAKNGSSSPSSANDETLISEES